MGFSGTHLKPYNDGCFYMFELNSVMEDYYVFDPLSGFRMAKALCQDRGLVLAKILSQEENDIVERMMAEIEQSMRFYLCYDFFCCLFYCSKNGLEVIFPNSYIIP